MIPSLPANSVPLLHRAGCLDRRGFGGGQVCAPPSGGSFGWGGAAVADSRGVSVPTNPTNPPGYPLPPSFLGHEPLGPASGFLDDDPSSSHLDDFSDSEEECRDFAEVRTRPVVLSSEAQTLFVPLHGGPVS